LASDHGNGKRDDYVEPAYDPAANLTYWGSGNAVPAYDPTYRPGSRTATSISRAVASAAWMPPVGAPGRNACGAGA
jgi:hypothetical protein